MKRPLITSLLLLIVLQIQAQTPLKIGDQEFERSKTELDSLKPLMVVQLKGERFLVDYVDSEQFIGALSPESISAIDVLKGNGAISIYGQRAKNGAVVLTLSNNEQNASLFEKIQAGELPPPIVNRGTKTRVDEKVTFSLERNQLTTDGKIEIGTEEAQKEFNRNTTVIVKLGNDQVLIESITRLNGLNPKSIKSFDLIRGKTDSEKDTVFVRLSKNSRTKRLFRKLKRAENK